MKKYAKVINEETKACEVGLGTNTAFYQSIGMTEMDVEQAYNGSWYVEGFAPIKPEPTKEEQQQARANAYAQEVDPLMAEYNRKKTFNLFEEGEEEALLAEVNTKVEEIKARFPYPVKESNNSDSVLSEAPENKGQSENESKEVI